MADHVSLPGDLAALPGLRCLIKRPFEFGGAWAYGCGVCCNWILSGDCHEALGRQDFGLLKVRSWPKLGNLKRHMQHEFHLKALAWHFGKVPTVQAMAAVSTIVPKVALTCRINSAASDYGLPHALEWIGSWSKVSLASVSANAQSKLEQVQ